MTRRLSLYWTAGTTTTTNSGDQSSDEPNVKLFLDSSSSGEDDFVVTYKKRRPVPRRTERLADLSLGGSSARVQHEGDESFDNAGPRRVASKTREKEARKPPRPPPARSSVGAWFLPGFPNPTQQQEPLKEDAKQKRKRSKNASRKKELTTLRAAADGASDRRVRDGTRKDPSSARRNAKANAQLGDRQGQVDTTTARHEEEESFSRDGFSSAASAGLFAGVFGGRRYREISDKRPAPRMVVDSIGERTKPPSVSASTPALRDESTPKSSWERPVVTTAISPPLPSEDESKEQEIMKKPKGPRVESKEIGSEGGNSRKKPVAFKAAAVAETGAAMKSANDGDDEPSDDSARGNVKSVTAESSQKVSNSASKTSL